MVAFLFMVMIGMSRGRAQNETESCGWTKLGSWFIGLTDTSFRIFRLVIREDLIIETTFVRRFTFDIGRDGVIQNISSKAFKGIFVLQVSRSCGRRWRRGTRACEANLRLKKSIQHLSWAHFPDTRTKIVLLRLFKMFRENQWNLRVQSQREGLQATSYKN